MRKNLILFLFFTSISFAQNFNGVVKNKVSDAPLEGVHISSKAIRSNTFTHVDGTFTVTLKNGYSREDSISFTSVGYEKLRVSISDLIERKFIVLLTPATEYLREVNIHTSKPLKQSLKYEKLAEMEAAVYDFASVVAGDKIYVVAGNASFLEDPIQDEINRKMGMVSLTDIIRASQRDFTLEVYSSRVQVYDLTQNKWSTAPVQVRKRAGHTAVMHDKKIYILGGKNLQPAGRKEFKDNTVEIFDLQKDSLVTDPVNPHMAIDASAFTYKENLMILGGSLRVNKIGKKIFSDEVHMLNFETGLWFNAGKMTSGKETVAVRVQNELYLIAGNDGRYLDNIEVLDLVTGRWENRANLPMTLKDPAVTVHNGIIYIYEKGNFLTYNTRTRELKRFDIDLKIEGPGMQYADGAIYLFGGYEGNDYTQRPVKDCFNVSLEEFENTAVLSYTRQ